MQNIEFVLDIILNSRLHCSPYSELNDPFEGVFHSIFHATGYSVPFILPLTSTVKKVIKTNSIKDLFSEDIEHSKICSLSKSLSDVRLWSHYADGHKGIAIEIDFPEGEANLFKVDYKPGLPEFSHTLMTQPSSTKVLSIKTDHWSYEDEYRIIQKDSYYPVTGNIKTIYTGHRISDFHIGLLEKVVPKHIPIIPTEINSTTVTIQPITK